MVRNPYDTNPDNLRRPPVEPTPLQRATDAAERRRAAREANKNN